MTDKMRMMEKVKKLLALADSPVEAEAALAMEKAGELMAKFGLTMAEVQANGTPESSVKVESVLASADRTGWLGALAGGTALAFDCKSLRSKTGNSRKHNMIFVGFPKDVEMAVHFFTVFKRSIDSSAVAFGREMFGRKNGRHREMEIDAYRIGMVKTICRRLRMSFDARMSATAASSGMELMVLKTEKVQKKVNDTFFRVTPARSSRHTGSHQAYQRGMADGENVAIHRPVSGSTDRIGEIG